MGIYGLSPERRRQMMAEAEAREENDRIMGILECEEAKGREPIAKALAKNPVVTLEDARAVLMASPVGTLARTSTSLDALMNRESPAALSGAGGRDDPRLSGLMAAASRLEDE